MSGSGNYSNSDSSVDGIDWYDGGVGVVLLINVLVSIILFIVWALWMRPRRGSNSPLLASDEDRIEEVDSITSDNSRFAWVIKLLKLDTEEIETTVGVDAAIYLRFQKKLIAFFFVLIILGLILVAINVNGGAVFYMGGFELMFRGFIATTAANMENGSPLLWFHAVYTIIISVLSYFLVYWLSITYKRNTYHPDRIDVRSFTCMIDNFPRYLGGVEDEVRLKTYFEQLYRGAIYQVYILTDLKILNKMHDLQKKYFHAQTMLQEYESIYSKTNARPIIEQTSFQAFKRVVCSLKCWGKRKDYSEIIGKDAIDYYATKSRNIQAQIVEHRRVLQQMQSQRYDETRGVGIGFVTFRNMTGAKRCIRDFATSEPPPLIIKKPKEDQPSDEKRRTFDQFQISSWQVKKAPHPDDIRWKCLLSSSWSVTTRIFIVNTLVFIFFFFFTTPLSIIGGLERLRPVVKSPSQPPSYPQMIRESWGEALLVGFFPTALLAMLSFGIPLALEKIATTEGHHTKSELEKSAMRKVFLFLFFSVILLPSLMLKSMDSFMELLIIYTPDDIIHRFSNAAPNWSFFLNYLINVTFLGSVITLMRIPDYFLNKWKMRRAKTAEDRAKAVKKTTKFRWGYRYSICLLVFAMGVFLSTFIPLVLPAALLFFIVRFPVDKYNLLASHVSRRSDFHIMKTVCGFMLFIVGCYQIGVFLFLLDKEALGPAILVIISFAASVLYSFFDCIGVVKTLSKKEDDEWVVEDEIFKGVGGDILLEAYRDAYRHPAEKQIQ